MQKALILIFLVLLAIGVAAHQGEEHASDEESIVHLQTNETDSSIIFALQIALVIIFLVLIYSVFSIEKMSENQKKISFALIAGTTILATMFIVFVTIQTNLDSETGGPVHWHADFEVWVCGEELNLKEPTGLDNKIGINLLHHHNDNRIHVEGIPNEIKDIKLWNFFKIIEGEFTNETISILTEDKGLVTKTNGDLCNGQPGKLQFYVNGESNSEFGEYIVAPFSTIPPGDFFHIVFDSKEGIPNGG